MCSDGFSTVRRERPHRAPLKNVKKSPRLQLHEQQLQNIAVFYFWDKKLGTQKSRPSIFLAPAPPFCKVITDHVGCR